MPSVAIIGTRGYPSFYGGFETAVRRIAPHLADAGWAVTVYGRPGGTTDDPLVDARITSRTTRGLETKSLSTLTYGLTSTLHARSLRPDVALVMNVANGYWLPLLRASRIPTLVNVDGIEWDRAKWGRLAKSVFRIGARLTAAHASELVFDARAIGHRWGNEFSRDGIFIPYGGDPTPDHLPVEPGFTSRRYVLLVARFVPENTVAEFLEIAPRLAENFDVVIVGSSGYGGELDAKAEQLSQESDRVHWLGHVRDDVRLASLWKNAGAYFHGHSVGGTNPALVQAMASGAPIVARDTVYNREVVGSSALLTPPDTASIYSTIMDMMTNPHLQETLAASAQQRAAEHYSWLDVCERYESALRQLLPGASR